MAHVTLGLDMGGQEQLLVEFARHTDRARHELTFVSLTSRGRLAAKLESHGGRVIALDEPPGLRPGMIWRLARVFRRGFDVVHTHDEKPLLYAAPAARIARVPVLVHTHHHGPLESVKRRHTMVVAWMARLTDRFVCVSHGNRRWLARQGVPAARMMTLHNGIDLRRFSYTGPDPAGPIVTVARLSPEKDQETLLRAVALARKGRPSVRLHIAGDGPCRGALEKLAQALGIADRVRFLGEISDVPSLLAQASLFVLSSVTEGVSLTLLEAMARGLPVLATRVGGNAEVVADGASGVLVSPRQPEALAAQIVTLLADPSRLVQLGRAGRARVEVHFDIRRMVADYEALYHSCRAKMGARSASEGWQDPSLALRAPGLTV